MESYNVWLYSGVRANNPKYSDVLCAFQNIVAVSTEVSCDKVTDQLKQSGNTVRFSCFTFGIFVMLSI